MKSALRLCLLVAFALSPVTAFAEYPERPITIVVPFSPGGTADSVARIFAQALTSRLNTSVIVQNREGGGGLIGWNFVTRAAPDGYTLQATDISYSLGAALLPNLPFDPKTAFIHIAVPAQTAHVLVVNPNVDAKTFDQFIALVKANPGKFHYGSGGVGTNLHIGFELLKNLTHIDIGHVPYRGSAPALVDDISGQVQAVMSALPGALPYIKSGQLRPLLVTSDHRVPELPDVPSAIEVGLPKMVMMNWTGFSAPGGTPKPIIDRLNKEINAASADPDVKKKLADLGMSTNAMTSEEANTFVNGEIQRWATVIKDADIKPVIQ